MNNSIETKSEIRARIDELNSLKIKFHGDDLLWVETRIKGLESQLEVADEDISVSIIESHRALCAVKNMGEKEAYGHDPALYYSLGICGEGGELANNIVKAMRFGPGAREKFIPAIESELPDVVIYSYILAYTHDINLTKLVSEKAKVVVERALNGYYGGPINKLIS